MLDIKFIRENVDLVRAALAKKHQEFPLDKLLAVDSQRLEILAAVETARAKQNAVGERMARATPEEKSGLLTELSALKMELRKREEQLLAVMKDWRLLMLEVPNLPDMSVPEGVSEKNNQEIRKWGEPPKFNFSPKSHIDLMKVNGLVDLDRGAKVAGFRGYFLTNEAVSLSFALWQYALEAMIKKEFMPLLAPALVRREALLGTGYLPQGEEDLYKTQDGTYLAGTGEVGAMGYFMDEVVELAELPKRVVAFSPCFRREAGAHGKDTKGLIRVHEFYKVEQLIISEASHETSVRLHEELTANAEALLQGLGLPYRVLALCGGELGRPQVKTYDIEVWLPSEGRYRETHSSSYYHDFQTRRLNIRYRDPVSKKMRFAHSLNNTGLATPRLLAALVEHYQQSDGSIVIPEILRPYSGGLEIVKRGQVS